MNDIESISMKGSGGSKMPHSHSTPAGVDGGSRTPPTTPRKAGKMLAVRVQMLDDTITMFQVQVNFIIVLYRRNSDTNGWKWQTFCFTAYFAMKDKKTENNLPYAVYALNTLKWTTGAHNWLYDVARSICIGVLIIYKTLQGAFKVYIELS